MLNGILTPVHDFVDAVFNGVSTVYDGAQDLGEALAPGSMGGTTTTGNVLGDNGVVDDVLTNLQDGDVTGAVADSYADVIGPGGVVNNLGEGGGLGTEGLMYNTLGLADGLIGTAEGLTDDLADQSGLLG